MTRNLKEIADSVIKNFIGHNITEETKQSILNDMEAEIAKEAVIAGKSRKEFLFTLRGRQHVIKLADDNNVDYELLDAKLVIDRQYRSFKTLDQEWRVYIAITCSEKELWISPCIKIF